MAGKRKHSMLGLYWDNGKEKVSWTTCNSGGCYIGHHLRIRTASKYVSRTVTTETAAEVVKFRAQEATKQWSETQTLSRKNSPFSGMGCKGF